MEESRDKMSFSQILRILLPEIQIVDFIQKHGWRGKKRILNINSSITTIKTEKNLVNSITTNYGPNSVNSIKEVAIDAKKGLKNLTLNNSSKDLDDIFQEIEQELNYKVWGQKDFIQKLVTSYKKAFLAGDKKKVQNVILLCGSHGTGKKRALSLLVDQLYKKRLIPYKLLITLDLSRYTEQEIRTNFISDCAAAFEDGSGTVLFTGLESANTEIISLVSKLMTEGYFRTTEGIYIDASGYFLISYLDQEVDIEKLDNHIPSCVSSRLPAAVLKGVADFAVTAPLSQENLENVVRERILYLASKLSKQAEINLTFEESFFASLSSLLIKTKRYGEAVNQWAQKEFYDTLLDLRAKGDLLPNKNVIISFDGDKIFAITSEQKFQLKALSIKPKEKLEDVLKELDQIVGLEAIKRFVYEMIETVRVQKKRAESGQKQVPMSLHMVFTGNPGTGKTTVARLISRILKSMEALSEGQLIEVSRQDLVGEYLGSTAPKTSEMISLSKGGVLFIDEAYSLARDKGDIFGKEAIDTLVKGMEDNRDNLVVILAGYTTEMEAFFKSNPGLPSRFPFNIEFPDYSTDEMFEILEKMAKSQDYIIETNARERLLELFESKQIKGRNDSGNGRLVRNLFEDAIRKQSLRLSNKTNCSPEEWKELKGIDFGLGERKVFDIESSLAKVIGLENVKAFVRTLQKQLVANQRRKEAGILVDTGQTLNFIFQGNPGTGKTTMARLMAEMLKSMGILKKGHLIEVDRSYLVAEYVGQTAIKTKEVVESALGGVLFIDEAYSLVEEGVQGGGFGKEAIDTLVRLTELHKDSLVVILAGYTEEMTRFLRVNPGLASRFPLILSFDDYSSEEMMKITQKIAAAKGFKIDSEVKASLIEWYESSQIPGKKDNGNGRLVRNTIENAIRNQSNRIADQHNLPIEELTLLKKEDFELEQKQVTKVTILKELDQIVGLGQVKDFIRSLLAQVEVSNRRKALGLPESDIQTLHMVFKGNPGTGKTTIARILAKLFKELGVIKSGQLVETDRSGLVAGYVGQTALKTKSVIEDALGGVLFIDEAYALARGERDFGQEAIDTLVKAMDDYRDQLVVILAGYDEDMERFLDSNAGLRSRFPHIIDFPDYTPEEMLSISQIILKAKGYKATVEAEEIMLKVFKEKAQDSTAGNGRFVRNLSENAIRNHAVRVCTIEEPSHQQLITIESEDVKGVNI